MRTDSVDRKARFAGHGPRSAVAILALAYADNAAHSPTGSSSTAHGYGHTQARALKSWKWPGRAGDVQE